MYSYLFNISYVESPDDVFMSILMKAKDRFSRYESIFVSTANDEKKEWKANKEALYGLDDDEAARFFDWLKRQYGLVPYILIELSCFEPYALYKAVKKSFEYDITVETNEPVEDFGDPGSYFHDMYKNIPPGVVF